MILNKFKAIIPMKCHSERIPNKNLKELAGKPLFYWIINSIKKVEYIEKIIIDTDCDRIADTVLKYFDVKISIRPKKLRGDFISVNKIIEHIIKKDKEEFYIQTHATNPLLSPDTLISAIEFFIKHYDKYDSVFSVTRHQSRFYDSFGKAINHNIGELIRTQDISPLYEENSNFYIFSQASFMKTGSRIGEKPHMFEVNKIEAIDIDDMEDFLIAEAIMKMRNYE